MDPGHNTIESFEKFGRKLADIEERIIDRNGNERFKNRVGPVKIPYTLLYPTSEGGITGKGIPNSVSI
ncbi:putative linoleate 9S-lipoxygenase 5 [Vitis vinifera]|uniref:Putative linoleate 9S-lipoxygenase 5 n=1 Tax=Vitis vinifera TaxID=29760 RepID=A0A438EZP9_VITVI|nr:putative linoleate 9S-lipoxygenase 5 [Vitis vinifera]